MKPFYLTLFFVFFLTTSAPAVVNINTGTMEDLTSLPGIGQVKAESIIKYRQDKGLFQKVEELQNVYGIGAKSVARLKDEITVGEASSTVVAAPAVDGVKKEEATAQKAQAASKTPPVKK
ncbi:MAG: helix-hairpin-helix domain-containing protein [Candidatus Electrothrix sp. AR5]|nr:helix-hairpin-helix domain-containing protein [Candidatus Electrothrix sp. AR5]